MIRFVDLRSHFGRHVSHADEVITDVNTRRVMVRAHDDSFTIAWDYPRRTLLEVRILRSSEGPAESADDGSAGVRACCTTTSPDRSATRACCPASRTATPCSRGTRAKSGSAGASIPCRPAARWSRDDRRRQDPGPASRHGFCLLMLVTLVLLPAAVHASGDGGDKQTGGGQSATQPDAQVVAAKDAAEADPTIAAVLAGADA